MRRSVVRLLCALGATSSAAFAAVAVGAAPAGAATEAGTLVAHGVGSSYSLAPASVTVASGKTATISVLVKNTGTATTQFEVSLESQSGPAVFAMVIGSTKVPSAHYWTSLIAPGKTLLVKITCLQPAGTGQTTSFATVLLAPADQPQNVLSQAAVFVNPVSPVRGIAAGDLFLKNGGQPAVGGSASGEIMSSPASKAGQTATFTAKVQNDTSTTATVIVQALTTPAGCAGSDVEVFKVGGKVITGDITSAAGYLIPLLAPGKSVTITETVKYSPANPACVGFFTNWTTLSNGMTIVNETEVPVAV